LAKKKKLIGVKAEGFVERIWQESDEVGEETEVQELAAMMGELAPMKGDYVGA